MTTKTRGPGEIEQSLSGREALVRLVAIALLGATAAIHVIWTPHKLAEAPYMGILFIVLAVASVAAAIGLMAARRRVARWVWALAALLGLAPTAGYVLSRTVALPQQNGLVGQWTEPLGIPTLVIGTALLVLAAGRLAQLRATGSSPALVTALLAALALVTAAPPAGAHDEEKSTNQSGGGDGRQEQTGGQPGQGRTGTGEDAAGSGATGSDGTNAGAARAAPTGGNGSPPPTPDYMVVPATAGAALLTLAGAVVLRRRTRAGWGERAG